MGWLIASVVFGVAGFVFLWLDARDEVKRQSKATDALARLRRAMRQ